MRRVTFSRNFTLSLSRTCQCYCKYCAFATHQAHIHAPERVEEILDEALKRNAKELLVLTGERPEVHPIVAERLKTWGHEDFTSYVVWACERALERGMLPHTNIGVLDKRDLSRLREVTASQGLMLESTAASTSAAISFSGRIVCFAGSKHSIVFQCVARASSSYISAAACRWRMLDSRMSCGELVYARADFLAINFCASCGGTRKYSTRSSLGRP